MEEYKVLEDTDENNSFIFEKVRWNTSKMVKHLIFISHRKIEQVLNFIGFKKSPFLRLKKENSTFTKDLLIIKKEEYIGK